MNIALYSDARSLPISEVGAIERQLAQILSAKYRASADGIQAWISHRFRFLLTMRALDKLVQLAQGEQTVLEMGGENPFTDLLRMRYPEVRWMNTEGDLRSPWSVASGTIDLIVSTEVFEHLQDTPDGIQETFARSGLMAVLREARRVLKPGGRFFCTTPNGASVYHLRNLLLGVEAWFCSPHVREYTLTELRQRLAEAGFLVEESYTVHCMTVDHHIDYVTIFDLMLSHGFPTHDRGDDIFLVARRE